MAGGTTAPNGPGGDDPGSGRGTGGAAAGSPPDASEPLSWLIAYFEERGTQDPAAVRDLLHENYVSLELLDSLGIVEMLGGIEEEFGVWLDPDEMQDPRFCTIAGLAELVESARRSE